jgi:hypothetical protein
MNKCVTHEKYLLGLPGFRWEAITDSREEHLATAFLLGSDRKRCGKLIEDLENDHVQRNDKYPKTLV